jgi:flagellar protein FlbD
LIWVTRLNGKRFVVNCELIKFVEETPDTVLTLEGGEKLMVREKAAEIVGATMHYRKRIQQEPPGTPEKAAGPEGST